MTCVYCGGSGKVTGDQEMGTYQLDCPICELDAETESRLKAIAVVEDAVREGLDKIKETR